ncbi:hypothetical protein GALMADRAFT_135626 [Galerina marginata CBS 339.88]|uniref:Uncharacterized protein n=1 Tax=Galerina marginata (strain CBS 339.88) TaxID=685588 RepID=A0A067TTF1_GALM3|nr:hypothetical protein GALMADRAFT_135626 [Galerina marginata CBS 339.88]
MAAPATYIRTIQTSFTAAQSHSSSAWASAATASALNHHHHNLHHTANVSPALSLSLNLPQVPLNQPRHSHSHSHSHHHQTAYAASQGGFNHTPIQSINTHNTHMYTHHLRDLTHSPQPRQQPAGAAQLHGPPLGMVLTQQGQYVPQSAAPKKSALPPMPTRAPPSPPPHTRRRSGAIRMPPSYKFDPFADEPLSPPAPFSAAEKPVSIMASESLPELEAEAEVDIASAGPTPTQPYTIHIPAAAPTDIQRYTPARPLTPSAQRSLSPRAASFTPSGSRPSTPLSSSPMQHSFPSPNLSKIVAGILLNRVHANKPMRRRVAPAYAAGRGGKQYVKSCLSSVVSVEA